MARPGDDIETLIAESQDMEREFATWQTDDAPPPEELQAGKRRYLDWYARATTHILPEDVDRFRDMYEGGAVIKRIRAFLVSPRAESIFYDPAAPPNPLVSRWDVPFDPTPRESMFMQRELLIRALKSQAAPSVVLDELSAVFRRLPSYLAVLGNAASEHVAPPTLADEADLQVLVHSILRLLYDDVRREDSAPAHAGGSTRPDFVLPEARVLVETKYVRPTLPDRRLGDELLQDVGRYHVHPECGAIFILVYDPRRLLNNPAAIERDVSRASDPPVRAIVVH